MPICNCTWASSMLLFFFLMIYWAGLSSIFFLDVIFLWTWFLFFNKFRWLIFFLVVYHFFGFNWASFFIYLFIYGNWTSFFNKGIYISLYKLTFPTSPFFTLNQTKRRKIKVFSILSFFHSLAIFYPLTFPLL